MNKPSGSFPPYCGPWSLGLSALIGRDPNGGLAALFAGRHHTWTYNTRSAIRSACDLLGLKAGEEILAPAYNCGTEIDPLIDAGLKVRLYAVTQALEIDPQTIRDAITPQTRALYVTHYFGILQPHMQELRDICDQHSLRMIEDCALSLLSGASAADGRTGDISVFCLYKFFPLMDGGALVANRPDIGPIDVFDQPAPAALTRRPMIRTALGWLVGPQRLRSILSRLRHSNSTGDQSITKQNDLSQDIPSNYYYDHRLNGAGLHWYTKRALRHFDTAQAVQTRCRNWARYQSLFQDIKQAEPLIPNLPANACPLNYPVRVANPQTVAKALQAAGIEAIEWWAGFHQGLDWSGQSVAQDLKTTTLALPLHQQMGSEQIDHVVQTLKPLLAK